MGSSSRAYFRKENVRHRHVENVQHERPRTEAYPCNCVERKDLVLQVLGRAYQ